MDERQMQAASRKPRADGVRNRERLMEAAKAGFAVVGPDVALEDIARRAGVGIGTLYRHFPSRDAIVEAVYRREVQQLSDAATHLVETLSPGEALHAWMRMFVDYVATKKVIASALGSIAGGVSDLYAVSGARILDAVALLVERARERGDIREDVQATDVLRALFGLTYGNSDPDWEDSARRLIDVVMDGLRTHRPVDSE
jgi:AcrR family transcriptional regulator